jgi:hypothetical protein
MSKESGGSMQHISRDELILLQRGFRNAIEVLLKSRFAGKGVRLMARIRQVDDQSQLERILLAAGTASNLANVEQLLIEVEEDMAIIAGSEQVGWKSGRQEGRDKGLQRGIYTLLKARFGRAGSPLMARIRKLHQAQLEQIVQAVAVGTASNLADVEQLLPPRS